MENRVESTMSTSTVSPCIVRKSIKKKHRIMQGAHYSVSDLKMSKIHTNPSKTALVALIYFCTLQK